MYTVETSLVLIIIFLAVSSLFTFTFNIERTTTKYINNLYNTQATFYKKGNKKNYIPDKISRIITIIDEVVEETNE